MDWHDQLEIDDRQSSAIDVDVDVSATVSSLEN